MESKRPWKIVREIQIYDADENIVDMGVTGFGTTAQKDKDNAALIVHCVNAHDGLVSALKEIACSLGAFEGHEEADIAIAALKAAGVKL